MLDFNFCVPNRFIVGKGSAAQVGAQLASHGAKRVLIVNDGGAYLAELMNTIHASIEAAGLVWLEMEDKATSPRLSLVMKGVEFVRANDIDFILAVGGGTVMDTAKAIGFMAVNDGDFTDYVLYRKASPTLHSILNAFQPDAFSFCVCSMWDLSSPTRDQICDPYSGSMGS